MLKMNWIASAALVAASLAGTVSAQSLNYRGAFTLPFEARFGNVVLQPGEYKISTLDGAKGIRITGESGAASILSSGYDLSKEAEKGSLSFVEVNGVYALQALNAGTMGKSLHFVVGKNSRNSNERASVKPVVEISTH